MNQSASGLGRFDGLGTHDFTNAAERLNFGFGSGTERIRNDRQLFGQFARAQNFDTGGLAIGQTHRAQRHFINAGAIFKSFQITQIHRAVTNCETGVVKSALGDAADERHLTAFKADADRAAGTGRLAFATATAGFAMAAGFALAKPLGAVFGAGTGFKIVQSHKNQTVAGAAATAGVAAGASDGVNFLNTMPRPL